MPVTKNIAANEPVVTLGNMCWTFWGRFYLEKKNFGQKFNVLLDGLSS